MSQNRLTLAPRRWYAWQSLDQRRGAPFDASPIFITAIEPLHLGDGSMKLEYIRLVNPIGAVQESQLVRVGYRDAKMLQIVLTDGDFAGERAFITDLSINWIEQHLAKLFPRFSAAHLPNFYEVTIDSYMEQFFGGDPDGMLSGVTANSFVPSRGLPEPEELRQLTFEREFSGLEAWMFLRGLKPFRQEDHWFIYAEWDSPEEGHISFRRSWTGLLCWRVRFWVEEATAHTDLAYVNLDERQRQIGTRAQEEAHLENVLQTGLLGHEPFPPLPNLNVDQRAARDDWAPLSARSA